MKIDRGIIKWQPFESLTPSAQTINYLLKEKSKINKPILSEEQKEDFQNKIIESYTSSIPIKIEYFKSGNIYEEIGFIKKLDKDNKKIILNNNKVIYFSQITKIKI